MRVESGHARQSSGARGWCQRAGWRWVRAASNGPSRLAAAPARAYNVEPWGQETTVHRFTLKDIKPIEDYELTRRAFQAFVDHLWRDRCVCVGPWLKLVFENRQTLLFQVQESLRAANLRESRRVQEELEVYNRLLPSRGQLLAVLLLDCSEPAARPSALARIEGVEAAVSLRIGARHNVRPVSGPVARSCFGERAIHTLRFTLSSAQVQALRDPRVVATIEIDHPRYAHGEALGPETRRSLLADLGSRARRHAKDDLCGDIASADLPGGLDERTVQPPTGRP